MFSGTVPCIMTGMPSKPKVVLVRPGIPANIGFVARLVDNFDLEEWVLVGAPPLEGTDAERTGAPAREALHRARRVATLAEALTGCTHVLGFTARAGKHRRTTSITGLASFRASVDEGFRTALVFGPEDRGLGAEESELCTHLFHIPTRGLPSLNLSHAVAIALYEWFRQEPEDIETPAIRFATLTEKQRLVSAATEALAAHGFPFPHPHFEPAMRRLSALSIEARDLRILEKIVRHASWLKE